MLASPLPSILASLWTGPQQLLLDRERLGPRWVEEEALGSVLRANQVSDGATFFLVSIIYVTRAYLGGFRVTISIKRHLNEFNSTLNEHSLLVPSPR